MKRSILWAHKGPAWACPPPSIYTLPCATSASTRLLPSSGRGPPRRSNGGGAKHSAANQSVSNCNASERIITMSVRHLLDAADTALLEGFALAAPAAASGLSSGRLGSGVGALLGLIGVVIGGVALARPASRIGTGSGRLGAVSALVVGLIGIALGGLVVATSDGGIGTGSGLAGAYVALVVGAIALALGGLTLARSTGRRVG